MIEKDKHTGNYNITCDHCSIEYLETEADNFTEAIAELKREGWRVFKNEDDEWTHSCLNCGLLD